MNFHRDRNLIILSVLFFAIIGSFLLGCSEGSESSPISSFMASSTTGNSNDGLTMNLTGKLIASDTNLSGFSLSLSKQNIETLKFDLLKTTVSLGDGSFSFNSLPSGIYKISVDSYKNYYAQDYVIQVTKELKTLPEQINITLVSKDSGTPSMEPTTGSVYGTVLITGNNTPVSNIYVQLLNASGTFINGALTNSNGNFNFTKVQEGNYKVFIDENSTGYKQLTTSQIKVTSEETIPTNSVVYLEKVVSEGNVSGATVKGKVKNQDGSSVSIERIFLYDNLDCQGDPIEQALVVGDGSFSFYNIKKFGRNLYLKAGSVTYGIGISENGVVSPEDITVIIPVEEGSKTVASLTFEVRSAYTNAPLEFVMVKLNGQNYGVTDNTGKFSFTENSLPIGDYNVSLSKEGYDDLLMTYYFDSKVSNNPMKFLMVEHAKEGYGTITGRFIDEKDEIDGDVYIRLYKISNDITITKEVEERDPITGNTKRNTYSETWYNVASQHILTTKTSFSDGLDGSFKLTNIEPGRYLIYVSTTSDIPNVIKRTHNVSYITWDMIDTSTRGYVMLTTPLTVNEKQTTFWTNFEQSSK